MRAHRVLLAAAALAVGVVGPVAAASADDYTSPPATVLGEQLARPIPIQADASVLGASARVSGSTLPVTGGDIAGLTLIGFGALGTGTILVRRSRRVAAKA